mmetsp:Transcript_17461/g.56211  ORF Transcript_17461/g.56211 Transcript_17461/m.56211 type:complete len:226 (+) Transcript_17461:100-777(+)
MLDPSAAARPLPPAVQRMHAPLASMLDLLGGDEAAEAEAATPTREEELKMELCLLLQAALSLEGGRGAATWRAGVEGKLLPLLLTAYGATITAGDRALLHLIMSVEARRRAAEDEGEDEDMADGAEGAGLAALGYLSWPTKRFLTISRAVEGHPGRVPPGLNGGPRRESIIPTQRSKDSCEVGRMKGPSELYSFRETMAASSCARVVQPQGDHHLAWSSASCPNR